MLCVKCQLCAFINTTVTNTDCIHTFSQARLAYTKQQQTQRVCRHTIMYTKKVHANFQVFKPLLKILNLSSKLSSFIQIPLLSQKQEVTKENYWRSYKILQNHKPSSRYAMAMNNLQLLVLQEYSLMAFDSRKISFLIL